MRSLLIAAALAFGSFAAAPAYADQAPVYTGLLSRVAVSGYDPVSYFTDGHPVRGSDRFRITHQGYEYRFASAEHLAAFRANPSRYTPQYGGYCAWAVRLVEQDEFDRDLIVPLGDGRHAVVAAT